MALNERAVEIAGKIGRKTAIGAAIGIAGFSGLSHGLGSQDNSSRFYDLATGDPNIDEGVFGTNIGMSEFLAPIGGGWNPGRVQMAQVGTAGARSGIPRVLAGLRSGMINQTTLSDFSRGANRPIASDNLRYANTPPMVDGSLVFGQYNSRFGG